MSEKLHPVITARLFTDRKCFGPGVAQLLKRVDEHGSLRSAAKSMEMAYSKAWSIMKNAENCLNVKLIESSTGGKNGGGAALTKEARQILAAYESYYNKLTACSESIFAQEFKDFLPE
ncbi:MAG: LysR family transcriptional regulator [Lachnospiraceae bacterium]|nr:LysR family transcriptional regulator [Lachnospiraceae bacterium]